MSISTQEKTIVRWKNDFNVPIESIIIFDFTMEFFFYVFWNFFG